MKAYRLIYKDGSSKTVLGNSILDIIKKYDLCTKENLHTSITELSGEQEAIALSNN